MMNLNGEFESHLSRLLARENLSVIYSSSAKTASFNEMTRTLCFPVFAPSTPDVVREGFSMHEIGHAKYTSPEIRFLKYSVGNKPIPFGILNVLEDIRIENLLKKEFAGAGRTFAQSYQLHFQENWFGDATEIRATYGKMHTMSRLNILAKVGTFCGISAIDEGEKKFFDFALQITTVAEMQEAADMYRKLAKDRREAKAAEAAKKPEPKAPAPEPKKEEPKEKESAPEVESGSDESDDSETDSSVDDDGNDQEDEEESSASAPSEDPENEAEGDEEEDSSNSSKSEEETEDGDSSESEGGEEDEEAEEEDGDIDSQESFDKSAKSLFSEEANQDKYFFLNTETYDELFTNVMTVPSSNISRACLNAMMDIRRDDAMIKKIAFKWRAMGAKAVQLAASFEQMVAGVNLAETKDVDTGELDIDMLWATKLTDRVFLEERYQDNQKNHGIVLATDFSGSMNGPKLREVIERAMIMVQFCRHAGIPFRMIGFGLRVGGGRDEAELQRQRLVGRYDEVLSKVKTNFAIVPYSGSLGEISEVLTSDMSDVEIYAIMGMLYHDFCVARWGKVFGLGGTPMMSVVMAAPSYIERFKEAARIQKVCFMLLTDGAPTDDLSVMVDGQAQGMRSSLQNDNPQSNFNPQSKPKTFFTCPQMGRQYQLTIQDGLRRIKELTGAVTVFYRISDYPMYSAGNGDGSLFGPQPNIQADFKKSMSATIKNEGGIDLQVLVAMTAVQNQATGSVALDRYQKFVTGNRRDTMFVDAFVETFG